MAGGFKGSEQSTPTMTSRSKDAYNQAMSTAGMLSQDFDPTGRLYKQAERNTLNAVRPTFAARGLLTSGPGLEGELSNLSGLNTNFAQLSQQGKAQGLQGFINLMNSLMGKNVQTTSPWGGAATGLISQGIQSSGSMGASALQGSPTTNNYYK
jgi:hypothetical protein